MSAVDRIAVWTDQQCSTWFKGQRVHCETHDERWPCSAARASASLILPELHRLIREDSPDGDEARKALGLESWQPPPDGSGPVSASKRLDRAGEAAAVILSKRIIRLRLPGHRLVYVRSVVPPTGTGNRIKWWLHGMTPEWEADQG